MEQPKDIPTWAINVRQLPYADDQITLWLWEFNGGAVVDFGTFDHTGMLRHVRLDAYLLHPVLTELVKDADRYIKAAYQQILDQAAYDDYNAGVGYEADDDD